MFHKCGHANAWVVSFPSLSIVNYRISSYSFRGNYSFLNLTLCTVTFDYSTYRGGNYTKAETIRGNTVDAFDERSATKLLQLLPVDF